MISLIAFSSIAVYMFFHILWWENSIQWDFIETIIDYIKKTRKYYYATFLVVYFSLSSFGYFFAYKYDIKSYLLKPIEYYEKATSYIKKTDLHDKIKLKKEKDEIVDEVVSNRFSSEATLKKAPTMQGMGAVQRSERSTVYEFTRFFTPKRKRN